MKKIQFGCGKNLIVGWENYNDEIDIRTPLSMFNDNSIDCIFLEHVLEHINHNDAWSFISECYRILKFNGAIRINVPSIVKIYNDYTIEYGKRAAAWDWWKEKTKCLTPEQCVQNNMMFFGHRSIWDESILELFLKCHKFKTYLANPNFTNFSIYFANIDTRNTGNSLIESIVIEGIKI